MEKIIQRYRYPAILLREIAKTDFKLRYQGSVLGYLWSLLRPLLMFVILYLVFVRFLKIGNNVEHAPVYLLVGLVFWYYFVEVTTGSVTAIVDKGDLLRKINIPKYVIILAGSVSALINLVFNFIVIGIFMAVNHVPITERMVLVIPLLLELFVLSLAVAFILSALFVKLRDVAYIWDIVVQAGFYLTPIFYLLSQLPVEFAKILILNPMAQIIQDARYALVTTDSATIGTVFAGNWIMWLIPIGLTIGLFVVGAVYFRSQSKNFAEEV